MLNLKTASFFKTSEFPDSYALGEHELPIVTSKRRKSIAVKMKSQKLVLEVPARISKRQLNKVLSSNHQWLRQRVDTLIEQTQNIFCGLHGQQFSYKGHPYQCRWHHNPEFNSLQQAQLQVCHQSKNVTVVLPEEIEQTMAAEFVCKQLEQHFKNWAHDYLPQQLEKYAEMMQLQYDSVTIKGYKSRWGSCYSDGRIQFNWRLMQAPEWVIDYVVVHELAHLQHANHSREFWQLVEQHYPQTQMAKKVLKLQGREWIGLFQL